MKSFKIYLILTLVISSINLDAQSINITEWIDIIENKPVNQVLNYGLYIKSTAPITAYYEEASSNNPDLFALKGKNALGTEFFTPFQSLLNSNYSQSKAGIDILATEDEAFQRKCYSKIDQIKSKGCTILFVSHSTQTIVELCNKAILIESGNLNIDAVIVYHDAQGKLQIYVSTNLEDKLLYPVQPKS